MNGAKFQQIVPKPLGFTEHWRGAEKNGIKFSKS
jgi:hypothetical protein